MVQHSAVIDDCLALLILRGMRMQNRVSIPFTKYRPSSTPVSFSVEAPDLSMSLTLPRWNTRSLYSRAHRNSDIGRIGLFRLDATYCYHADVHPENVDQLTLEFTVGPDNIWTILCVANYLAYY